MPARAHIALAFCVVKKNDATGRRAQCRAGARQLVRGPMVGTDRVARRADHGSAYQKAKRLASSIRNNPRLKQFATRRKRKRRR